MTLRLALASLFGALSFAIAADRPNFVLLMSEDNSKHYLKLFDDMGAPAPNIEKLAASGIAFDHAFSNGAVCSVARTTLATACFGPRIGTQYHRKYKPATLPASMAIFAKRFRDAGYFTANHTKTDYNVTGDGVKGAWNSNKPLAWRQRPKGQPFLFKQSFAVCHESSLHFPASDVTNKPTKTDPSTVSVPACYPDTPLFRYTVARYLDNMAKMDAQIGAVVDALENDGLLEDTFVIYVGDHGGVLPGSKGYAWERGLHVPMVVRIPANFKHLCPYQSGSRAKGFVSFIDIGPSMMHAAGIAVPDNVDGKAFLGKGISKTDVESRDVTYGYADRFDEKYDLVRTVRKGRFKYVRSYQPFNFDALFNEYRYKQAAYREWRDLHAAGKLSGGPAQFFQTRPPEALYDVVNDPWELNNLATKPQHAAKLAELRSLLTTTLKSWPDLSFFPESYMVAEGLGNTIKFGKDNQARIARLIDVADLSLVSYENAASKLASALADEDPWVRYWGLISSSVHGKAAGSLANKIKNIAAKDDNLLVRARAAEYLGLTGLGDAKEPLRHVLGTAEDPLVALLAANTAVLLKDGPAKVDVGLASDAYKHQSGLAGQRRAYLTDTPSPTKRKRTAKKTKKNK